MRTRNVTVVSIRDGAEGARAGVLTRSISNADELDELVRASEQAARDAAPADDAAPLVENYPNDDDWAGDPAETSVAVFEQFAASLGEVFDRWRKSDRLLFGFAEHQMTSSYLGTSTGLRRRFDQPDGRVEINGKSDDYARSAYVSQHSNDFTDVDPQALAGTLDQRLDWAATKIDLPAGRYETILPPTCVADLNIYAYITASARDAEEGRSVYAGADGASRIGERLSPLPLRLYSDPELPRARVRAVPDQRRDLRQPVVGIRQRPAPSRGRLDGRRHAGQSRPHPCVGAKSGAEPCSMIDNLIMDGDGTASLDEMIAATERGLLLTTLWYIREVDPQTLLLTGLTRDGVYLVENGAVSGAVNNFRFNESPIDLWSRVTEVGRTEPAMSREWNDFFRRSAMPALRVPDFNMSTVSKAS